jgi:uncharacterized membrane protein YbhN (UPF0104 family)
MTGGVLQRAATTTPPTAPPGPPDEAAVWVRHPADLARLLAAAGAFVAVMALTYGDPQEARGISLDLVQIVDLLPSPVRVAAGGVAQLAAVGAPVALLALVLLRRWLRLALVLVATGVVAAAAATALQGWVDDSAPSQVVARLGHESWLTGAAFPSPAYLAAMAAMTTVLVPNLGPSWRRAAWWILAGAALLRVITAVAVPLHVTIMAFAQSARAFGIDLGFAQLGALYLTANTVAAAAPTPGGVGAIEAALVAVLTGAGVDATIALSTVLVFRLVTFWLPVPPSWLALRHLRSTDAV